jgi:Leucine-rich repeat (LRR) protein
MVLEERPLFYRREKIIRLYVRNIKSLKFLGSNTQLYRDTTEIKAFNIDVENFYLKFVPEEFVSEIEELADFNMDLDSYFKFIPRMDKLVDLDISLNYLSELSFLKGNRTIRVLNVAQSPIGDEALKNIATMENLEGLLLYDLSKKKKSRISRFECLGELKNLKCLNIGRNEISRQAWNDICKLRHLKGLDLSYLKVDGSPLCIEDVEKLDLRDIEVIRCIGADLHKDCACRRLYEILPAEAWCYMRSS